MNATYLDHMGSDLTIVNAARVSFKKFSKKFNDKDEGLINYLAREGHWLPFRHPHVSKAPLFVARQAGKHQVGMSWSEVSRRYVDSPPEFYKPTSWRGRAEDKKQGSSDKTVTYQGQEGKCPNCNVTFTSVNNRQIYCSSSCQSKAYRKTHQGWRVSKLERLKGSAARRGLEIDLSPEDIPMPESCAYLGLTLDYESSSITDNSPSVDRIDNTKGYIKGNIQTISNKANIMKHNASDEDLLKFCKSVLALHGGYILPQSDSVDELYNNLKVLYKDMIDKGVCPEQVRMLMPQSQMVEWHWTGSLLSWAHFIKLRTEEHAQKEIRDFAAMFIPTFEELYPVSWKALCENM